MKIVKETVFYGFTREVTDGHIGMAILENGAWVLVHENGTAVDTNGNRYARVSREFNSRPMPPDEILQYACESLEDVDEEPAEALPIPDTDLESLGWTTESDKPIILTE